MSKRAKYRKNTSRNTIQHLPRRGKGEFNDYRNVQSILLETAQNYYRLNEVNKIYDIISQINAESLKTHRPARYLYLVLRSISLTKSKSFCEAESNCNVGLKEFPDSLDFYYLLAKIKYSMKDFSKAIEFGQKYLQILRFKPVLEGMPFPLCAMKPHLSNLQNTLGNACRQQNQVESAALHYEAAIAADAGNHLPYLDLATMQYHLKNIEETQKTIERGLSNCTQVQELLILKQTLSVKQTVSACLVVQDEENLLPGSLESIRNWVDEIVIVDTGSNDKTVSIALSYGAKVFNQQWDGEFAKHRNFSIEKGTCDWILLIDANEQINEDDVSALKELINIERNAIISVNVIHVNNRCDKRFKSFPSVRLFRRSLNLRFEGIVDSGVTLPEKVAIVQSSAKIMKLEFKVSPERNRNEFVRAHAFLEKQLKKKPNDIFMLFKMTHLLRGAGKWKQDLFSDEIIRYASKVVSLTEQNNEVTQNIRAMSLNQLAWAHFYKGNLKQAQAYAESAISLIKDYLDPWLLLGQIYLQLHLYERAGDAYSRYLDLQSKFDPILETRNCVVINTDSRATAYYGLGTISEKGGNLDEAAKFYRKCFKINPEHGDIKQKMSLYEKSTLHTLSSFEAGLNFLEKGSLEEAESHFLKAVKDSSDKRSIIEEIGSIYFEKTMFNDALKFFQIGLDTNPYDANILINLANCYFNLREFAQAQKYYETASELANAPIKVFRNLGLTFTHLNQVGNAIISFRKYLDSGPKDQEVEFIMADLSMNVGDFKSALTLYEGLLRTNSGDYQTIFKLSECYLNLGHEKSARIGYYRVLDLNPEFEPAKKRLSQLEKASEVVS